VTLRELLVDGRVREQAPSAKEVRDLLTVVDRDLRDASVKGVSVDGRFQHAYQAARQASTVVLRASGYRTAIKDAHWVAFHVLPELMGPDVAETVDYFEACRTKRHRSEYDSVGHISDDEADELVKEARKFTDSVRAWLKKKHPKLSP
jgi:hypothetical protein